MAEMRTTAKLGMRVDPIGMRAYATSPTPVSHRTPGISSVECAMPDEEGDQRRSEAIIGTQRHSEALRGTQRHSDALRGTQVYSGVLRCTSSGTRLRHKCHPVALIMARRGATQPASPISSDRDARQPEGEHERCRGQMR